MSAGQGTGRDALYSDQPYQTLPVLTTGLQPAHQSSTAATPSSSSPLATSGFTFPQRAGYQSGQAGDMYPGSSGSQNPYTPHKQQHSRVPSQGDLYSNAGPNIHLHQSTPQGSQLNSPIGAVPDSLQPGTGRPNAYNVPHAASSISQSTTQPQHYMPPPRTGVLGSSHSHSKSSPIGLDQKYIPFSGSSTPTASGSIGSRMYAPPTPTGSSAYSPLGLSDIRPNAGGEYGGDFTGPNAVYEASNVQTNSNYLAPWATYAYDWCKWPVSSGGGCGKMALGSYLEDPHNFVSWN